jgi:hypothetical protein
VLAGGFGLGVAVMAALLGVGSAILEQARAPDLSGGGDVVVGSAGGGMPNARFVLSTVFDGGALGARVAAAAPRSRRTLYLIDGRETTAVRVTGGIPSRDRALRDREIAQIASWTDTPADAAWTSPSPGDLLRTMDAFHPIPDVPARAASWSEWLYFNGRTSGARFYLAFMTGPRSSPGRRTLGVSLQLEREGRMTRYAQTFEIDEQDLLRRAPDLTAGKNTVRLEGMDYRITVDLPAASGRGRASGALVLRGVPGRSLPPFEMHGAGGWVSGYVVPVMAGSLDGALRVDGESIDLSGGAGYHDHNWGFWDGVSWQWGQVQGAGLSFVYGRVFPPADAIDAARIPGFLLAIGEDGVQGYATDVTIDETNDPATGRPRRIVVRGRSDALSLTFDLAVAQTTVTPMRPSTGSGRPELVGGRGLDFVQMRGQCDVSGRTSAGAVHFTAPASAETFRGRISRRDAENVSRNGAGRAEKNH